MKQLKKVPGSKYVNDPPYVPPVWDQVNLLNFMATQEGLEDQMLGITVAREEAELEARREQLVLEDAENKRVQKEIEDTILDLLKNSEGNILDDEVSATIPSSALDERSARALLLALITYVDGYTRIKRAHHGARAAVKVR